MEQRRYPRVVAHYPGTFRGERTAGHAHVLNLSWAGCAFKSDKNLQVGDFLQVEIHLPDVYAPVKVDVAVVRWAVDQQFGVDFIQVGPDDEARLRRFVKTPKLVRWFKDMMTEESHPRTF